MATYRALEDISPGLNYPVIPTGQIFSDGAGQIPVGWIPSLSVEPLDSDAQLAYWRAGPDGPTPVSPLAIPPKVYWVLTDPVSSTYTLTGAGASLGGRQALPVFLGTPPPFNAIFYVTENGTTEYMSENFVSNYETEGLTPVISGPTTPVGVIATPL